MDNNDLFILFPDLRHGWFDAKILSLGKLALMSMIFLVPQALRRKFTLMILCLPFMMIIMIVVFCYHLLWRINLIMITIYLLYLIATFLNLLPLQLIKLTMLMLGVVIILCMRLMIRMLYVIVILLSLLILLLKVIMREENMVVKIFMLLKHLSMC